MIQICFLLFIVERKRLTKEISDFLYILNPSFLFPIYNLIFVTLKKFTYFLDLSSVILKILYIDWFTIEQNIPLHSFSID